MDLTSTVKKLKKKIAKKGFKVSVAEQKLWSAGRQLKDHMTLAQAGVGAGGSIDLYGPTDGDGPSSVESSKKRKLKDTSSSKKKKKTKPAAREEAEEKASTKVAAAAPKAIDPSVWLEESKSSSDEDSNDIELGEEGDKEDQTYAQQVKEQLKMNKAGSANTAVIKKGRYHDFANSLTEEVEKEQKDNEIKPLEPGETDYDKMASQLEKETKSKKKKKKKRADKEARRLGKSVEPEVDAIEAASELLKKDKKKSLKRSFSDRKDKQAKKKALRDRAEAEEIMGAKELKKFRALPPEKQEQSIKDKERNGLEKKRNLVAEMNDALKFNKMGKGLMKKSFKDEIKRFRAEAAKSVVAEQPEWAREMDASGTINVGIHNVPSKVFVSIEMARGAKVKDLKQKISATDYKSFAFPVEKQKLIFKGTTLNDDDSLATSGISGGSEVQLFDLETAAAAAAAAAEKKAAKGKKSKSAGKSDYLNYKTDLEPGRKRKVSLRKQIGKIKRMGLDTMEKHIKNEL